ncbi:MAG: hypothetical protein IPI38_00470 [Gemmatimonadetes bacterium]|nr:hypothetical protein [Gemmatimonadota bacterium]MBK6779362.1 hypothetical protein [Gemmatimonadota bacterium]MBK7348325.1 hypothetical protein [Gemmatimonadota bacterium]MBK7713897.1 hypothetical protein [Gemmatimonadota bacterium]MBK7782950.1 hypothetical protein [Gemmatimonadota bacterium]
MFFWSHGAAAQVREATDSSLHAACLAAAQRAALPVTLRSGISGLKACGVTGPSIVAGAWAGFAADDTTLNALVEASRYLRDSRVLAAVRPIAASNSYVLRLRLAALQVLVTYLDSSYVAVPGQLDLAISGGAGQLSGEPSFKATLTTSPLAANAADEIGTTLAQLASASSAPVVQAAARFIRAQLYYRKPAATPLLPNALTMSYRCGNRFRIRNSGDIRVKVTYAVVGAAESKTFAVAVPAAGQSFKDTYFTTSATGTVQLSYNGTVVQTKANEGTVCGPGE